LSGVGNAPFLEGTSPLVSDRYIITLAVASSVTVTAGQVVEISTDWTVDVPSAANSLKVIGIALTGGTAGQFISVVCRGICRAISGGAMNAGDQVTNGATGGQVITDNSSKNTSIMGIALSTVSSSGQTVYVLLW
jgi:glutamate synthase domain-containing protein 3